MTNRANNAAYATIKQQLATRLGQLCSPAPPGLSLSTATVSAASLPKIGPYDRKKEGND
jgi:hypothetical protein